MQKPLVCVTLSGRTAQQMADDAPRAIEMGADVVEVRLDILWTTEERKMKSSNSDGEGEEVEILVNQLELEEVDHTEALELLSSNTELPLLLTCRPQRQGGYFPGDEKARIEVLRDSIACKPGWIDLEVDIESELREELLDSLDDGTKAIASIHSMEGTPPSSEIVDDVLEAEGMGSFVKACYQTKNRTDALRIFEAALELKSSKGSSSVMGLGPGGDWTRIHAPILDQHMVYSTTESGWHLAQQGRINASDLRLAWKVLDYE